MTITLIRRYFKSAYVIGRMYIDGQFICNTMEPTDRGLVNTAKPDYIASDEWKNAERQAKEEKQKNKVGTTAIPTGTYRIGQNISKKFGGKRLYLRNVPGFEGIMIHEGNMPKDTAGCILVGENKTVGRVLNSKYWLKVINDKVMKALDARETVVIALRRSEKVKEQSPLAK